MGLSDGSGHPENPPTADILDLLGAVRLAPADVVARLNSIESGLTAREAAVRLSRFGPIVMLDKDLGILAGGVLEGRRIFSNTMKYVLMGTSSNFGNMFSADGGSLRCRDGSVILSPASSSWSHAERQRQQCRSWQLCRSPAWSRSCRCRRARSAKPIRNGGAVLPMVRLFSYAGGIT